jgi:hypothetical protein|tara:strand:- start:994 stop:1188 length:195 start_codon:yes stop_codon:yes gene_type:complete
MDDFNKPGSNKIGLTPVFKDFVVNLQIDNVVKILDAKIERCNVYNSDNRDEVYKQITITYKDTI